MSVVNLTIENHIAFLTLSDAPKKNAMTVAMGEAVQEAVAKIKADESVRVVVLHGEGDVFSAGGDFAMLAELSTYGYERARQHMLAFYSRYLSLATIGVPTIAAIHGAAIGAGLCIALACDLVLVEENTKLALNFAALGLHPGMGATYSVPRRVGPERAAELLYTARRFDGREAAEMGLVLKAAPSGMALIEAKKLAQEIASRGPIAVRGIKKKLGADVAAMTAALEHEAHEQALSYGSKDYLEGMASVKEKRMPVFQGV